MMRVDHCQIGGIRTVALENGARRPFIPGGNQCSSLKLVHVGRTLELWNGNCPPNISQTRAVTAVERNVRYFPGSPCFQPGAQLAAQRSVILKFRALVFQMYIDPDGDGNEENHAQAHAFDGAQAAKDDRSHDQARTCSKRMDIMPYETRLKQQK